MHGKSLSFREAKKILKTNGFEIVRRGGNHIVFANNEGDTIALGNHQDRFSMKTWKRECKKHDIKI